MSRFAATPVDSFARRLVKSLAAGDVLPAVLTYPIRDYQGDEVVPDGGDWSRYPDDPVVNWEHETPVGVGTVTLKSVKLDGQTYTLPVGTTKFFESAADLKGLSLNRYDAAGRVVGRWHPDDCLSAAGQAAPLVRDEIVTGVSLEFDPIAKTPIGKSLIAKRDAYRFERWLGLGWAHTSQPVNAGARLVERQEKALRALERGGGLPVVIRKSLTALARPLLSRPTTVRVTGLQERPMPRHTKALDETVLDDPNPEQTGEEMDGEMSVAAGPADGPTPTVKTLLDGAQQVMGLCDALDAGAAQGEHTKGKKYIAKICDRLRKDAADMQAMADKIQAEIGGGEEVDVEEEVEVADEPEVEEDTGDVMTKSLRKSFPNYRPQRIKIGQFADVRVSKGSVPAGQILVNKAEYDAMRAELKRIEKILAE